ncbi:MAG: methyltransferase domain-containing protein [Candidatus Woesearchaeota archaeon]|nr:methyltransferase domain-containing protein [Candidatus Woesearchaeota archaeon]
MANINTKDNWDRIWEKESENPWRFYPKTVSNIKSVVGIGKKVLELGCGAGMLLDALKEGNDVTGLDISSKAIDLLDKKGIKGVVSVLPDIPFMDETFDVVIAAETLEHLDDDKGTLKEAFRVCKKQGTVIVTVPNSVLTPQETEYHVRTYTKGTLQKLFHGFTNDLDIMEFTDRFCTEKEIDGARIRISLDVLMAVGRKESDFMKKDYADIDDPLPDAEGRKHFLQARKAAEKKDYDGVISSIDDALSFGYNRTKSLELLGVAYIKKNDFKKAFEVYNELISLGSDSPEVMNNIANLYFMRKEYEKTLHFLKKALGLGHHDKDKIQRNIIAIENMMKHG